MLTKLRRSIAWVSGLKLEMEIEHLNRNVEENSISRESEVELEENFTS